MSDPQQPSPQGPYQQNPYQPGPPPAPVLYGQGEYEQPHVQQPPYQQGQYQQPQYQQPPYQQGQYQQPQAPQATVAYPTAGPYAAAAPNAPYSVMAIVGFIAAFFVGIAGLIISLIARSKIRRTGERGSGLALAGVIIGAITTASQILAIVLIIVTLAAGASAINSAESSLHQETNKLNKQSQQLQSTPGPDGSGSGSSSVADAEAGITLEATICPLHDDIATYNQDMSDPNASLSLVQSDAALVASDAQTGISHLNDSGFSWPSNLQADRTALVNWMTATGQAAQQIGQATTLAQAQAVAVPDTSAAKAAIQDAATKTGDFTGC